MKKGATNSVQYQARKKNGRENRRRILDTMFGARNMSEHEENEEKRFCARQRNAHVRKVNAQQVERHK